MIGRIQYQVKLCNSWILLLIEERKKRDLPRHLADIQASPLSNCVKVARIKHLNNVVRKSFLSTQIGRTGVLEIDVVKQICHFYEYVLGLRYMKSNRKQYPPLECA